MGIGITDVPNPFTALIEANTAAGARSTSGYQEILSTAATLQEFEKREVTTDLQREQLQQLQRTHRQQQQHAAMVGQALSARFTADFQFSMDKAAGNGQWGNMVRMAESVVDEYYPKATDSVEVKQGKMWAFEHRPEILQAAQSWNHSVSNQLVDLNRVLGDESETADMRPLSEIGHLARDNKDVALGLVKTADNPERQRLAQHFGYGYEQDLEGNAQIFKTGTPEHAGWLRRRAQEGNLIANGMDPDNAHLAVLERGKQEKAYNDRVNQVANDNSIPFRQAEEIVAIETANNNVEMQYDAIIRANPLMPVPERRSTRRLLTMANGTSSTRDLSDAESEEVFNRLDPRQREFITLGRELTGIEAAGKTVANPDSLGAAELLDATGREEGVRAAIRSSLPGMPGGRLDRTSTDARRQGRIETLLGSLGDPASQKAYNNVLRAAKRGSKLSSFQEQAARAQRVRHSITQIGETEESITAARAKGRFESVEADLRWFGVNDRDVVTVMNRLATPTSDPTGLVASPEQEAAFERATSIQERREALRQEMRVNSIPEPGTRAFDIATQGSEALRTLTGFAAAEQRVQAAVLDQVNEAQAAAQKDTDLAIRGLGELSTTLDQFVEGKADADDIEALRGSVKAISDRLTGNLLGLNAPDQGAFGAALGTRGSPFKDEASAQAASNTLEPGTKVYFRNASGDTVESTVR